MEKVSLPYFFSNVSRQDGLITNLPSKSVSTHGTTLGVTGIFEKLEFPPILIGNEKKKTLVAKKHLYFYKVGKHVASQITCQCSKLLLD